MSKDMPQTTCFVISPIGEENSETRKRSDQIFKHIISPAAQANQLVAVRSDHISMPGVITQQVIRQLINARMVVADLTDHNANVFYELALRHAFRKPVVQLIVHNQSIPFDVGTVRTVHYRLDLDGVAAARDEITRQITLALAKGFEPESPVTMAARLEDLSRSATPQTEAIVQGIFDQVEILNKSLVEIRERLLQPADLKNAIPAYIQDGLEQTFQRYSREIDLLQAVRQAGVIGLFKRREAAMKAFSRYIDEESREIMVIGSSLKGLLQKEEYQELAGKLKFKHERGLVKVKFLLTHPIVADFRASQENRRPTEIGVEIINSLETLKSWGVDPHNVRLYLGTPTCFAIKTSRQMLVNPYPYISVSYDSPCLILEYSPDGGTDRPDYFFDEFNIRHFGAWDTDLAVHIERYDDVIGYCRSMLTQYADGVEELLSRGRLCIKTRKMQ